MDRTVERWYEIQQLHGSSWVPTSDAHKFQYGNDALEHVGTMRKRWPDADFRVVMVTRSTVAWDGAH
jgi:hypothetical protein